MLRARATTELCKAIFPDVTAGLAVVEVLEDEAAPEPMTTKRRPPTRRLEPPPPAPAAPADTPPPVREIDTPAAVIDVGDIPGADQPTWGTAPAPPAQSNDPTLAKRIHAEITKAFPDENSATRDRWRHALVAVVTRKRPDGPVSSSNDLDLEDQLALSNLLTRIMSGDSSIADGLDDTVELRVGGGWRYTIAGDPPTVTVAQGDTGGQLDLEGGEP
jgi:hypothetical protein